MILPSSVEIASAIYGAWRLLRGDRTGMRFFDLTIEGFWKSFGGAALIVAPGYLILVALHLVEAEFEAGFLRILLVQAIGYVILWVAFPLVMSFIADALNRPQRYIGYIVAYNWSQVIQMAVVLPVDVLAFSGVLPGGLVALLVLVSRLVVFGYLWYVTTTALDVGPFPAVGLVLVALVIEFVAVRAMDGMIA